LDSSWYATGTRVYAVMKPQSHSVKQALADAYVLGQLSGLASKRFQRWLLSDAELRALVQASEQRWHRLAAAVPPMPVSEQVWQRIEARAFAKQSQLVSIKQPVSAWQRVLLLAASLLFVGWAGLLSWTSITPSQSQAQFVALVLDDARKVTGWQLSLDGDALVVETLVAQPSLQQRVYELWVIPEGYDKPVSLGLIPETGERRLALAPEKRQFIATAKKFGVSVEPLGGSPTGQPTTAPVYHGELASLKKS
jgi:anti-sigma-K factor RskA